MIYIDEVAKSIDDHAIERCFDHFVFIADLEVEFTLAPDGPSSRLRY